MLIITAGNGGQIFYSLNVTLKTPQRWYISMTFLDCAMCFQKEREKK